MNSHWQMMILGSITLLCCILIRETESHGRLMIPPARNSMWREGFPNPVNWDDNELFCGGAQVQHELNGGKCGVCGDPWHVKQPRPHEAGGKYGNGIIARRYVAGQVIKIFVDLTTNHKGYFEMSLCPNNDQKKPITQECLQKHKLTVDGTNSTRYYIPVDAPRQAKLYFQVKLPDYLTCSQCVLQWNYTVGNTWGNCGNGTSADGCGPQETFVNCADIAIFTTTGAGFPPGFKPSNRNNIIPDNKYVWYFRDHTVEGSPLTPLIVNEQVCLAKGSYTVLQGADEYCRDHCLRYPPSCPQDRCHCLKDCWAVGEFAEKKGADHFCLDHCIVSRSRKTCDPKRCRCK